MLRHFLAGSPFIMRLLAILKINMPCMVQLPIVLLATGTFLHSPDPAADPAAVADFLAGETDDGFRVTVLRPGV